MIRVMRVLVTYATRCGSTADVAAKLGEVLSREGVIVDLRPVNKVGSLALDLYDAVIVGSMIRGGTWSAEAVDFLDAHREALSRVPLAYFTVCATLRDDTPENRCIVSDYHIPLHEQFPELRPLSIGMFAGKVDYASFTWLVGLMAKSARLPNGDWRDWNEIERWTRHLLPLLKQEQRREADTLPEQV
jgi:menaquinone-dependent protoporphyrinogen oxidase